MELTITQNSALYLIGHGGAKRRSSFLRKMRLLSPSRLDDVPQRSLRALIPKFHRDNGR